MASSGVKVDDECIRVFNDEFKLNKSGTKLAYILFGFNADFTKIVIIDKIAAPEKPNGAWEQLIEALPHDQVRYAVADIAFRPQNDTSGTIRSDMGFITWAPDGASIKQRMIMAASADALKNALTGFRITVQANDYSDLVQADIIKKLKGVPV